MFRPKEALLDGVKILDPVLRARGFQFQFRVEARGSVGNFAWGEFVREDRRLELHFRQSLGLVRYHVGDVRQRQDLRERFREGSYELSPSQRG